jgi:hypothetical protein
MESPTSSFEYGGSKIRHPAYYSIFIGGTSSKAKSQQVVFETFTPILENDISRSFDWVLRFGYATGGPEPRGRSIDLQLALARILQIKSRLQPPTAYSQSETEVTLLTNQRYSME